MGLDAVVQCNCWKERTAAEPPAGWEDIYLDCDGWISSRLVDRAWEQATSYDEFHEQVGELDDAMDEWRAHGCPHEDMEYCCEWISNWGGVGHFQSLIERMGGNDRFKILAGLLPEANGGQFPAEQAAMALEDLDAFDAEYPSYRDDVSQLRHVSLVNTDTQETVSWRTVDLSEPAPEPLSRGSWELDSQGFHMVDIDGNSFRSTDFTQCIWRRPPIMDYEERMMWKYHGAKGTLRDTLTGESIVFRNPISIHENEPWDEDELWNMACSDTTHEQHFVVTVEAVPDCLEYGPARRLRRLLEASLETGNPIQWC